MSATRNRALHTYEVTRTELVLVIFRVETTSQLKARKTPTPEKAFRRTLERHDGRAVRIRRPANEHAIDNSQPGYEQ